MRRMAVLAAAALAGCMERGPIEAANPDPAQVASTERIHFVTTRAEVDAPLQYAGRSETVAYGFTDIAVPAGRAPGDAPFNTPFADERTNLIAVDAATFPDQAAFFAHLQEGYPPDREIGIYVHGFNNTHAEVILRHAQLVADYELEGPQVSFSWASAAKGDGYVHDRDSVLITRDDLASFLVELDAAVEAPVVLLAHSMGSHLTMEALRTLHLRGLNVSAVVDAVVLVAPDIDTDIFLYHARAMQPLPDPFVIIASQNDRLLQLSALVAGQTERLGLNPDRVALGDLGVQVVDITDVSGNFAHMALFHNSDTIQRLSRVRDALDERVE